MDILNEALGFEGSDSNISNALDYVIGQYEQYTVLQMNQYVNTIANKGMKIRPHLVHQIKQGQNILLSNSKEIVGKVPGDSKFFENVTERFARTGNMHKGKRLPLKTGTLDVDNDHVTNTVVSFFPEKDPKVSITCAVPYAGVAGLYDHVNPCIHIVKKAYEAYEETTKNRLAK